MKSDASSIKRTTDLLYKQMPPYHITIILFYSDNSLAGSLKSDYYLIYPFISFSYILARTLLVHPWEPESGDFFIGIQSDGHGRF